MRACARGILILLSNNTSILFVIPSILFVILHILFKIPHILFANNPIIFFLTSIFFRTFAIESAFMALILSEENRINR